MSLTFGPDESILGPYVSRLAMDWLIEAPAQTVRRLDGTLAFVDISGFTRLSELLAARGKVGAEELNGYLDTIFSELLGIAYENGGELVKWGGDAVLLWYSGDDHAARAVDSAWRMQHAMRRVGRLKTSAGRATLRMSVGVHSGEFHFFLVGRLHRELLVTGPAASRTAHLESVAEAGEIVVSAETADSLEPAVVGEMKGDGFLIAAAPHVPVASSGPARVSPVSVAAGPVTLTLPAAVKEFVLAGPIESEHRQIGVGFVEFSGVDRLLTVAGDHAVAAVLDQLLGEVQEICQRHGVTFWETDIAEDGGKVMLVSGAPNANDDHPGIMLMAVREILDTETQVSLRAGVNCGRVFTGDLGPAYRRSYSAKGDAINLAARVMGRAAAGQLLASDDVVRRSRIAFETEAVAPFHVKGKSLPVHAHRVIAPRSGRTLGHRAGSAMVGREKEVTVLEDALSAAIGGSGSSIEVIGPPGIGKSRLVEELQARSAGCRTLGVVCDEYGSKIPFSALGTLVRQALSIEPDEPAAAVGVQLARTVARLAPDLEPWLPLLASVVGGEVAGTPDSDALNDRFRRERQAEALLQLLSVVLPGPTLFVVEDGQWVDDASAALLEPIARAVEEHSWLFVVARRTDGRRVLQETATGGQLELGPLASEEAAQLVRMVTAEQPLVPHQREMLVDRSGGNPLFLLELIGGGIESGFDQAMPETVEGVFATQIDRLPPKLRRVLRIAAVLGVQVPVDVLDEMIDHGDDVAPLIGDYFTWDGSEHLRFRHNMLREAAYEGLPYSRRRELHARAGRALERRAGDQSDQIAGLLAVHYGEAGDEVAAWRYARLAAEQAQSVNAYVEAATFLEQALSAGRATRDRSSGELMRVAEALGEARAHLGQFTDAEAAYRRARRWAGTPLDVARLLYKTALAADRSGNYRRTLQMLTRAEHGLAQVTDPASLRLRAEIGAQYGLVRYRQGRGHDAVRLLKVAVERATTAQAADVLANALLYLDIAELTAGMAGDGSHARRALEMQRSIGDDPWLEARALNQLGIRAYFAGRWSEAVEFYSDSRRACDRAGDRWTAAVESANIAEVLSDQGHLEAAEAILQEALQTYRAAGTPTFVADGTRLLGRLAGRRGDPALSRQLLAVARGIYESDGESLQVVLTDAILAESLLRAGEAEAAAELARRVLAIAESLPGRHLVAPLAHRVLGVSLRVLGMEAGDPRQYLHESIELARRHEARYELALSLQAVSDLWPTDMADWELAERDALFGELGVGDSARRLTIAG